MYIIYFFNSVLIANSAYSDQTTFCRIWSGSTLFARHKCANYFYLHARNSVGKCSCCNVRKLFPFYQSEMRTKYSVLYKQNGEIKINYRKFPKYSDTPKICCNYPKNWTRWLFLRVMHPKDAEGIANSVDPDQTAPLGAVWSGSALFAQACPSENLGN